jgi:pimeloyl-ACP methyl ester carboxylesterase
LENAKQFARFLDAFIKALKLKRVVVWGHSMGGSMAVELAQRRRKRVAALIAMSSSPDWDIPKAEIALWNKNPDAAFKANLPQLFAKKAPVGIIESYDKQLRSVPPLTCRADIAACNTFACAPKLKRVKAPTLVVAGDEEAWMDGSQRLKAGIKGAVLTIVPGAGHAIALEQPQKLCAAVDSFLARLG